MNFPQKLLINLLRIINSDKYSISPFSHSTRKPPALTWKLREIFKLAKNVKEDNIQSFIKEFYIDDIRNSFYHSDYCIAEKSFRYKKKSKIIGTGQQWGEISLEDLSCLLTKCFAFFDALFSSHTYFREQLAKIKKFHKLPQYEVLELLSKDNTLYGFHMHFSNGSKATFTRESESVEAINIIFKQDGSVNFMIGDLSKQTNSWKVNGKIFNE